MVSREIIDIWTCIIEHANWLNVPIRFAIDISAFAIFPKENKKNEKSKQTEIKESRFQNSG